MEDKKYLVSENLTFKEVIDKINCLDAKCVFAVDKNLKLKGSLTDGDIRRAILKKANFHTKIKKFINPNPKNLNYQDFLNKKFPKFNKENIEEYKLLPVIDKKKRVIKVLDLKKNLIKKNHNLKSYSKVPVVIMAGGKGTRLKPFTDIIPKPLIPVNGKSMIEHILEKFHEFSFKNFFLSINFKSNLVKSFFSLNKEYKIKFLHEKKPLGTAGSLKNIKLKKEKEFIVINCDTLLKINFQSLFQYHKNKKYILTIVASQQIDKIPYGVCKLNGKLELKKIDEKPSRNFFANTGCYVVNAKVLKYIKKNTKIDMDDLITLLLKKGHKIGIFPINYEEWSDLGNFKGIDNYLGTKD